MYGSFGIPARLGVASARQIPGHTVQGEGNEFGMAHWKQISGGLTAISAGSRTNVWGVNSSGSIYRCTGDDTKPWIQIPGALTDIGAAADGTVWGVNAAGNIYRYTGDQPS